MALFVYLGRYRRAEFTFCKASEGVSVKMHTSKQVYPLSVVCENSVVMQWVVVKWKEQEEESQAMLNCPECGSSRVIKNGTIHTGKPKFACKTFGRQFVEN